MRVAGTMDSTPSSRGIKASADGATACAPSVSSLQKGSESSPLRSRWGDNRCRSRDDRFLQGMFSPRWRGRTAQRARKIVRAQAKNHTAPAARKIQVRTFWLIPSVYYLLAAYRFWSDVKPKVQKFRRHIAICEEMQTWSIYEGKIFGYRWAQFWNPLSIFCWPLVYFFATFLKLCTVCIHLHPYRGCGKLRLKQCSAFFICFVVLLV